MSQETYRQSVFLDGRIRAQHGTRYEVRFDDLFLMLNTAPEPITRPAAFILHTTFCCSTLLARYLEQLPRTLVLKEPLVLTQLGLRKDTANRGWREAFELCLLLLGRRFSQDSIVVVKPHEPFNSLAEELLAANPQATVTLVITPARQFLLSVLKSPERRRWVRSRIPHAAIAGNCDALAFVHPDQFTDAQAAAWLWCVNRFIFSRLCVKTQGQRVLLVNGDDLARCSMEVLRKVLQHTGITIDPLADRMIAGASCSNRYSKDTSIVYDGSTRERELTELEIRWGWEADSGVDWILRQNMDPRLPMSAHFAEPIQTTRSTPQSLGTERQVDK
jgi:hypothetical protein